MTRDSVLHLESVRKSYGGTANPIPVLKDIGFSIPEGDFCAILGPSGSGKSTLLNIIGLLDHPDDGQVLLDGRTVDFTSPTESARLRNALIGFVFQSFQLLPRLNAWENVALPLLYRGVPRTERRAPALAMLERVGLAERADHRPSELSGGQCQRVALARALIGEPKLILADEPTGSLDSGTSAEMIDLLRDLNHRLGMTIVMVTHDRSVAERCDRRIELLDGHIIADSRSG